MKVNTRLVVVAVILGLITVMALNLYLKNYHHPASDKASYVEVVVAQKTIPIHSRINADMLTVETVAPEAAHPDAVHSIQSVVGGIARAEIIKGEQVLVGRIFTEERKATLSYRIPDGMRAMAIPVNEVSGVAGYISAGDKVDLLVTYQSDEISAKTITYTVFQNITVLAVGDSALEKDSPERQVVNTVTLSVTPAQAEVLAFAYLSGWFHLSLRSPTDDQRVDLNYYSPDNLDSFRER